MKGIEPRVNRSCDPLGLGGKYLGNKTIERWWWSIVHVFAYMIIYFFVVQGSKRQGLG